MAHVVAIVVLETEDPLLTRIRRGSHETMRRAVVAALPAMSKVVAIMPESEARLMIAAHVMACADADLDPQHLILSDAPPRRLH